MFYDTNGDGVLSPADVLRVINYLNGVRAETAVPAVDNSEAELATTLQVAGEVEADEATLAGEFPVPESEASSVSTEEVDRVFAQLDEAEAIFDDLLPA